jgi:hypothetical protein
MKSSSFDVFLHDFGRRTDYLNVICNVARDDGAGSNDRMCSNCAVIENESAHSYISGWSDRACPGDIGAGHDAAAITNRRVMPDHCPAIDYDMTADCRARGDDDAWTHHRSFAHCAVPRDARRRMNERRETKSKCLYLIDEPAARRRTERAYGKMRIAHRGDVIDPVNGKSFQSFRASLAIHVFDEPGDFHSVDIGCDVSDLRRERAGAKNEQLHLTIPT